MEDRKKEGKTKRITEGLKNEKEKKGRNKQKSGIMTKECQKAPAIIKRGE
jgi:hypothetical protein